MSTPENLMNQAGYTAEHWLRQAVESIDSVFGEGYAKKNPELVSGFIISASNDQIASYLRNLSDTLSNGH